MKFPLLWQIICIFSIFTSAVGCTGAAQPTDENGTVYTAVAKTISVSMTETPTDTTVTIKATNTPAPTNTPPPPTPTPCPRQVCTFSSAFPLALPIASPGRDTVEPSYRFGSTQNGRREPHHGVEFINKAGTPVLAAADGKVLVAGDDKSAEYGPMVDFYGKVVIIQHDLPGIAVSLYTTYGHLLTVGVKVGQKVKQGEQIGEVGLGGVAAGTHLHFEVRYGENDYNAVRNPELWLQPHQDENGQLYGVLAGRIVDKYGELLGAENIVVKKLDDNEKVTKTYYLTTYEDAQMLAPAPWYDSFAISDLPAGTYQISFIYKHEQKYKVKVQPGGVTYVYLRGE